MLPATYFRRRCLDQPYRQRAGQPGHHPGCHHRGHQRRRTPARPRRPTLPQHSRRNPPTPRPRLGQEWTSTEHAGALEALARRNCPFPPDTHHVLSQVRVISVLLNALLAKRDLQNWQLFITDKGPALLVFPRGWRATDASTGRELTRGWAEMDELFPANCSLAIDI